VGKAKREGVEAPVKLLRCYENNCTKRKLAWKGAAR